MLSDMAVTPFTHSVSLPTSAALSLHQPSVVCGQPYLPASPVLKGQLRTRRGVPKDTGMGMEPGTRLTQDPKEQFRMQSGQLLSIEDLKMVGVSGWRQLAREQTVEYGHDQVTKTCKDTAGRCLLLEFARKRSQG